MELVDYGNPAYDYTCPNCRGQDIEEDCYLCGNSGTVSKFLLDQYLEDERADEED